MSDKRADRGPVFDGVHIGRPATGALLDAGYRTLSDLPDLPDDLVELAPLHGVGPNAASGSGKRRVQMSWMADRSIARLRAARAS